MGKKAMMKEKEEAPEYESEVAEIETLGSNKEENVEKKEEYEEKVVWKGFYDFVPLQLCQIILFLAMHGVIFMLTVVAICSLINGSGIPKFVDWYCIKNLDELSKIRFDNAVNMVCGIIIIAILYISIVISSLMLQGTELKNKSTNLFIGISKWLIAFVVCLVLNNYVVWNYWIYADKCDLEAVRNMKTFPVVYLVIPVGLIFEWVCYFYLRHADYFSIRKTIKVKKTY